MKCFGSHTFATIPVTRKKHAIKARTGERTGLQEPVRNKLTNPLINLTDLGKRNFVLESQPQGTVKILTNNKPYDVYNNVLGRE